jgi:hypothetical protein
MISTESSNWKGLRRDVLVDAGIHRRDGLVVVPYLGTDGKLVRERLFGRSGRCWWGPGETVVLLGLERLPGFDVSAPLLVCEGESDTLAAREHGFQAVGCPGAVMFRSEWARLLEPFPLIYPVGDGDEAGQAFVWSVRTAIPWARPVVCPSGEDLRSLLQANRRDVFAALVRGADNAMRLEHAVIEATDLAEAETWLRGWRNP